MAKVRIISNGTPQGTQITCGACGETLIATSVTLGISMTQGATADVRLLVEHVDVEANATLGQPR